jgi:hypothetical protein
VERTRAPFWIPPPHYSTEDFVYNGMYIPKNTAVILNCYEIHHNEERYPDPYAPAYLRLIFNADKCAAPHDRFAFKPERFLGDTLTCAESSKLPNAMDRDHWAFGAGCVQSVSRVLPAIAVFSSLTFCSNSPQPSHLSSHPYRRKGAVSGHFAVALGVRNPTATR